MWGLGLRVWKILRSRIDAFEVEELVDSVRGNVATMNHEALTSAGASVPDKHPSYCRMHHRTRSNH